VFVTLSDAIDVRFLLNVSTLTLSADWQQGHILPVDLTLAHIIISVYKQHIFNYLSRDKHLQQTLILFMSRCGLFVLKVPLNPTNQPYQLSQQRSTLTDSAAGSGPDNE